MEKEEVLDAFEAAKKAADAASDGGGAPEVDRCVDALRRLMRIKVTMKVLVDTQVGKRLRYLTKHPQGKINSVASDLLDFWKKVVREETSKDSKKNGIQQDKNSMKVESESERAETVKIEKVVNAVAVDYITTSSKVEKISVKGMKVEGSKLASIKIEKAEPGRCMVGNGRGSMSVDKIPSEKEGSSVVKKPSSSSLNPLKLTSMIKCNNPARDKIREMLAEAFSRVSKETSDCDREEIRNIGDEVDACDPIRVAVTVESAMFEKLGPSTGAHKAKYRSILFNLKDNKNIDFRRKVLLEELKAEGICDLTPEDMASDDRKISNQQIKEKALFECERAAAPKATTDQFKCGRCGQRKCTYYQMQTRSADEPMTTFVTCVNCNNHWKFC